MDKDLITINDLKEELPIRWGHDELAEFLKNFIAKLKHLNALLSQNSYVKETNKILNYIIQDATNSTMVLLAGLTGNGKTTLVNALMKRAIFSSMEVATEVNTIICYGEKEEVRAHFLDGQVATFDMDKIELFTVLDTSSAKILREGLDFIEIFVENDLLKMVTLIDTTPIQISGGESAYLKESILNRADDVFWIFKHGNPITPAELKLLKKLKEKNLIPLGILNGLDSMGENDDTIISSYENQISDYVRDLICISSKDAFESVLTEDREKWNNSQIELVIKELEKTANNQAKRLSYLTERFIHWLKRFQTEIEIIPEREPYFTSLLILKDYIENFEAREIKEAEQNQHFIELTEQYKIHSLLFNQVDTLFQLIQVMEHKMFDNHRPIDTFREEAKQYLEKIREYRKLLQEYKALYEIVDKKHQKLNGMKLLKHFFGNHNDEGNIVEEIEALNKQQQILEKKYNLLKIEEEKLLQSYTEVKNLLNQLVQDKLTSILNDCSTISFQRKAENAQIQNAIVKLTGFDSIVEAKSFILKFVNDYVLNDEIALTKKEKNKLLEILQAIENVNLDYQTFILQYEQIKPMTNDQFQTMVAEENPFCPLKMTEENIRIPLDEPPTLVELKNE